MEITNQSSDQNFESYGRSRAFTWHGSLKDYPDQASSITSANSDVFKSDSPDDSCDIKDGGVNLKKPSSRKNAWGCMSYADLIAKAIESSPDQRLTLNQIYGWMVENVPYFKDKGHTNSSAGWKNSIRHNLSLHRRFVRVQNEGTGKSSWWVVNNEVKSSKVPRRRAASMDTKAYEKKRRQSGQKQDVVSSSVDTEQPQVYYHLSNNLPPTPTTEGKKLDSFASAFCPSDLRAQIQGGQSGLGHLGLGRLSPIPALREPDMESSAMTNVWSQRCDDLPPFNRPESLTETVGESLAELFDANVTYETSFSSGSQLTVLQNLSEHYVQSPSYHNFQDHGQTYTTASFPMIKTENTSNGYTGDLRYELPDMATLRSEYLEKIDQLRNGNNNFTREGGNDDYTMVYRSTPHLSYDTPMLRQMLSNNHYTTVMRTAEQPVKVKAERSDSDSYSYSSESHTSLVSGNSSMLPMPESSPAGLDMLDVDMPAGQTETDMIRMEESSNLDDLDRLVKQEVAGEDGWEFDMDLIPNNDSQLGSVSSSCNN
jgi:forkhead box protein O3